jgi:regulator of sigma E protease
MLTILVFIVILGFLVFIHELGHFLVARRNGIKAEEFGFGFPPRAVGIVKDEKTKKWNWIWGGKHVESANTIYSLNWFPIGGFVRIKGENGDEKDTKDSFASKPAWARIKVLAAGVLMNFFFAWILFSIGFMLGTPQEVEDPNTPGSYILIDKIEDNSPASSMGIKMGDVIGMKQIGKDGKAVVLKTTEDVQNFINSHANEKVSLKIKRGKENLALSGTPKVSEEDGKARLGIGLVQVAKISYSPLAALGKGLAELGSVFVLMITVLKMLLAGNKSGMEVTGVVGIAVYTGQIIPLGLAYLMRFAAILSVNLGVINALPIPALDGGRILFILIEKIKGSPVSQKVEQIFHTVGFALLMALMVFVTYRDFLKFDIIDKIKGIF